VLVTCAKCKRQNDCGEAPAGTVKVCACGAGVVVPEKPIAAGKLGCPACGAPVDPSEGRCHYCDAKLATVVCPRCFAVAYLDERHCSQCGEQLVERLRFHSGAQSQHGCPRCAEHPALLLQNIRGYPLEGCPSCDGLWVDRETIERLCRDREQQDLVAQKAHQAHRGPRKQEISGQVAGYIPCPVCQKLMHRKNFARFSGVVIDVCKSHGSWFDADELSKILQFIATGGLEKEALREKEELKEELRELRSQQMAEETKSGVGASPAHRGDWQHMGEDLTVSPLLHLLGRLLRHLLD